MTASGDERLSALVRVSAALGSRDRGAVRGELARAFGVVPAPEVEEVLLQSHLFVGFPGALEALAIWRELREEAAVAGDGPDMEDGEGGRDAPGDPVGPEGWEARGMETCRQVYGEVTTDLRRNIRALHPDMEAWMIRDGYGKVLGRPGLPLHHRELCIAATLAALDAPVQLRSHLRGALRTGGRPQKVGALLGEVLEVLEGAMAPGQEERIRTTWARVRDRFMEDGQTTGGMHVR